MNTDNITQNNILYNRIPWFFYLGIITAFTTAFGFAFDLSWHYSVGRDSAFTLPHLFFVTMPLYCLLIPIYLIIKATFFSGELKSYSIRMWKFFAPGGAWLLLFGGSLFFISFGFDDWWHKAFGLDFEVQSTAHLLINTSGTVMFFGFLFLCMHVINLLNPAYVKTAWVAFLLFFVPLLWNRMIFNYEISFPSLQHHYFFYFGFAFIMPLFITAVTLIPIRFTVTKIALATSILWIITDWALSHVATTPLLGPIYNQIDHLMIKSLQIILIPSALFMDIVNKKIPLENRWWRSIILGSGAFIILVFVQWFYSEFLLSAAAESFIFLKGEQPYFVKVDAPWWKIFWVVDKDINGNFNYWTFATSLIAPLIITIILARINIEVAMFARKAVR